MTAPNPRLLPAAAAVNLTSFALSVAAFMLLLPALAPTDPMADAAARLAHAAALSVWPGLAVLAAAFLVMIARACSLAFNPIDDPESRFHRVAQRILTNTVEQTAAFLPGLWALGVLVPADSLGAPAALTVLFMAGRVLFAVGYLIHPYARSPGMAATLTATVIAAGWAVLLAL